MKKVTCAILILGMLGIGRKTKNLYPINYNMVCQIP